MYENAIGEERITKLYTYKLQQIGFFNKNSYLMLYKCIYAIAIMLPARDLTLGL